MRNASAQPTATGSIAGRWLTIAISPSRESAICTLPSLPRVGPSSRPMYCAKMRHGSTPRVMCTPMSRCSGVPTSSGAIAIAIATEAASLPRPGVEGAGDLALAVEDVAALLDAARDQHVAVDLEQVLAVEAPLPDVLERARRLGYAGDRHGRIANGRVGLQSWRGEGRRLAARGAPKSARALERVLPRLRRCATLVRGVRERASRTLPECGGELLHRCPACSAPFSSTFAVDCEACGGPLRAPELNGIRIRR